MKQGLTRNYDGTRYSLLIDQWKSFSAPQIEKVIDLIDKNEEAIEIYDLNPSSTPIVLTKINALFTKTNHNKLGAFATILLLISLFLPAVEVNF